MAEEEVAEEAAEGAEEAVQQPQGEETRNSSEQNHLPSMEIDRTSTDSFRIFRDTCL